MSPFYTLVVLLKNSYILFFISFKSEIVQHMIELQIRPAFWFWIFPTVNPSWLFTRGWSESCQFLVCQSKAPNILFSKANIFDFSLLNVDGESCVLSVSKYNLAMFIINYWWAKVITKNNTNNTNFYRALNAT